METPLDELEFAPVYYTEIDNWPRVLSRLMGGDINQLYIIGLQNNRVYPNVFTRVLPMFNEFATNQINDWFKSTRNKTIPLSSVAKRQRITGDIATALDTVQDDLEQLRDLPLQWETLAMHLIEDFLQMYSGAAIQDTQRAVSPPKGIAQPQVPKPLKKRPIPEGSRQNPVDLSEETESEDEAEQAAFDELVRPILTRAKTVRPTIVDHVTV